jgi:diacylglycerol kinase family enzyme
MNAQWYGDWNLGPRAHPDDGLLDTYDVRLRPTDLFTIRSRLPQGSHLPHPGIVERRAASVQVSFDRPRPITLDRVPVGPARTLSVRVEPDALTVVV